MTTERDNLLTMLGEQRQMFRVTLRELSEDDARRRSTVSELTLGGLLRHIGQVEKHWVQTVANADETAEFDVAGAGQAYVMRDDQTVAGLLAAWDRAAAATDAMIRDRADLDELIPLPTAPWQPERRWWTVRQILLHILREVAHHSGHADIIRESIDGQNSTFARAGIDPEQAKSWARGKD